MDIAADDSSHNDTVKDTISDIIDETTKEEAVEEKSEDTVIKIKRKKHPHEDRYPGRPCRELFWSMTKLFEKLSPEQLENEFLKGFIESHMPAARKILKSLKVGDRVGIALRPLNTGDEEFDEYGNSVIDSASEDNLIPTLVEIQKLGKNKVIGKDIFSKSPVTFGPEEISLAQSLEIPSEVEESKTSPDSYFEILMRDGKPYGLPEFEEVKVRLTHYEKKDPAEPSNKEIIIPEDATNNNNNDDNGK